MIGVYLSSKRRIKNERSKFQIIFLLSFQNLFIHFCTTISVLSLFQQLIACNHGIIKLDHERCSLMPMYGYFCRLLEKGKVKLLIKKMADNKSTYKIAFIQDSLNYTTDKGGTVDKLFILGHRNEFVHYWLAFNDII